jgi:hypothetical protein
MENGRCYLHGGKSLRGLAHPNFKTGRYSKYLPARMLERYEESKADSEQLALKSEIALVDARISDLLQRMDPAEPGELWETLQKLKKKVQEAARSGNTDAGNVAVMGILDVIARGARDFEAWADVFTLIERRRRLVESEQKRLVAMQQMVTTEEVTMLVTATVASLKEHVEGNCDDDVARRILGGVTIDVARLFNRPAPAPAIGD